MQRKLVKLHRSKNDRMLAGVFGGIGEYLGWSPNMLRLLFVLSIPLTVTVSLWVAMVAYAVMWVMMPEATPSSYIEHDPNAPRRIN
ncbi:MAG: PspC domain-containing protein [Moraxella sp.]|nr:PspC domain-containing protein [Moraxella sp.]